MSLSPPEIWHLRHGQSRWMGLLRLLMGGRAPRGLYVQGDLCLAALKVRSLPEGMHVEGDLDLRQCGHMAHIGEGLEVSGHLLVGGHCAKPWWPKPAPLKWRDERRAVPLPALPERLWVGGDLRVTSGHQLRELPRDLDLGGSLRLISLPKLEALPEGLHVRGDLEIGGRNNLRRLPAGLRVDGDLKISNTPIRELPCDLKLGGKLELFGCYALERLPKTVQVPELRLRGARKLRQLPQHVRCTLLRLEHLPHIEALPEDLACERLRVQRAPVRVVPRGTYRSLILDGTEVRDLTKIRATELLEVRRSPLTRLPKAAPTHWLHLEGCPLTELPANQVARHITLAQLPVRRLPPLGQREKLVIRGCENLEELPRLRARRVHIAQCPALRSLPEQIRCRDLTLIDLPALETLPSALMDEERWHSIMLWNLDSLRELPPDLEGSRGYAIHLGGRCRLRSLPPHLVQQVDLHWAGHRLPRLELLRTLEQGRDLMTYFERVEERGILRTCLAFARKHARSEEAAFPESNLRQTQRILWRSPDGRGAWHFIAALKDGAPARLGLFTRLEGRWCWIVGDRDTILATVPGRHFVSACIALDER